MLGMKLAFFLYFQNAVANVFGQFV